MVLSVAVGGILGGILAVGLTDLFAGIAQSILMGGLIGTGQQIAAVVGQVICLGGAVAVLCLQEGVGIAVAIELCVGVQVAAQQIDLGLLLFGQGKALSFSSIGQRKGALCGRGRLADKEVGPGFTGLGAVNLLIERLRGIQTGQGQVAAIGVDVVVDIVDVVVAQLGVAQLVAADGGGNGVLFVHTAGFNGAIDADGHGKDDQRYQHDYKGNAVDLNFFCFLLLGDLTLGHLSRIFRAKLLLFGCTHEIISSHCSLFDLFVSL